MHTHNVKHPAMPLLMISVSLMLAAHWSIPAPTASVLAESVDTHAALQAKIITDVLPQPPAAPEEPSPTVQKAAARLSGRMLKRFGFSLGQRQLADAIEQQRALLEQSTTVTFVPDDGKSIPAWTASVSAYPWLTVDVRPDGMESTLNEHAIGESLRASPPEQITAPVNTVLRATHDDNGILRAETDALARPGYDLENPDIAQTIRNALTEGAADVDVALQTKNGRIVNETGVDLGALDLLAVGHSDFAGSGVGRKSNVRKGLSMHLHNAVVPADADFSFNAVIADVPASEWALALGIFDGWELRPVAGGGLCQVATTLYRAILGSGMTVKKRANHSLFVHYYEKYGVGIDATIFPGKQDLTFHNNTGYPLLIQAETIGDEAFVRIYGTDDGRQVALDGPFFRANAPEDLLINGRKISGNEIAWKQTIRFADGRQEENLVVSRYKAIPRSVVTAYTADATAHAAAD